MSPGPVSSIQEAAKLLERARSGVALTGAGVSTDSGIPDFRGDAGLWKDYDPMDVASIEGFEADPARFYRFWSTEFATLASATPSAAHRFLAGLESRGRITAVITQNIDGLHQAAGSRHVLEVHGSFRTVECLACGEREGVATVFARSGNEAPACRACGARRLKPDVVLFGEMLPPSFAAAEREVDQADLLVAMGTSLGVYPVAGLVARAKRRGAAVVILNRDPTPFDSEVDVVVNGELGAICRQLGALLAL